MEVIVPIPTINPKISGQGVVYKTDGTVSKPEPQPKEQDNGRNPN